MDQAAGRVGSNEEQEMSKTEGLASPQALERIDIQDSENDSAKLVLSPARFVLVFIAFSVSFALTALDQTILSTALATIASDFDAVSDLTWIASAYFLPQAGLMLLFGRMLSIFWPKIIYLCSIVLFELGSLICAVAPSANVLIFGRAFAGVGAAGLWVSVMSIFAHISTLRQRPLLLGVMGAIFAVCSVAGPIVGGALTEQVTWRWCFWLNLPCGGLALLLVSIFLPNIPPTDTTSSSTRMKWLRLDYIGAFLSVAMVTLLLIPLQWGDNVKSWNDASVIALLVVAAILALLFIAWEYGQRSNAILPLTMALSGSMPGACLEAFFVTLCFTITIYYIPLFYQVKGYSPTHSGIDILPFMISGVLMSFASGGVVSGLGYVWPFLFGSPLLAAVAGGLLYTVGVDTGTSKLIGYQILLGAGLGAAIQNPIVVAQAQYQKDPDLVSQATSLVTFMQLLGSSIGLAISSAVLSGQLVRQLNDVRPALPENVKDAVRKSLSVIFTLPEGIRVPVMDAYVDAVKSVFLILVGAAAMCSLSSLLISHQRVNVKPGAL